MNNKGENILKNKQSFRDLWENNKKYNICVIRTQERKEKECSAKKNWKNNQQKVPKFSERYTVLVFYCCCKKLPQIQQIKKTQIYYLPYLCIGLKSGTAWLSLFLHWESHKDKINVSVNLIWRLWVRTDLPAHAGCWQNSFSCRTEVTIFLLTVSQGLFFAFPGSWLMVNGSCQNQQCRSSSCHALNFSDSSTPATSQ